MEQDIATTTKTAQLPPIELKLESATLRHGGILGGSELTTSVESMIAQEDHWVDEDERGEWTISFASVSDSTLTLVEARAYLAECAALVEAVSGLPAPATLRDND